MSNVSKNLKKNIMKAIKKKPMSLSELSREMELRRDFVSGYLEALRHMGEVNVVKVGRSKVYRPKK